MWSMSAAEFFPESVMFDDLVGIGTVSVCRS